MREFLVRILSLTLALILFSNSFAQTNDDSTASKFHRFEVGGHFTVVRRADANAVSEVFRRNGFITSNTDPAELSEFGLGGRLGLNITKHVAIEAEATFFPDDKTSNPIIGVPLLISEPGGRKFQAVAGPKIGYRGSRFGVFGKLRLGFIRFDRYEALTQLGPPGDAFFAVSEIRRGVGFLNVDVGGVFEYYPTKRTIFRVDVGDTIIRYRSLEPENINPSLTRHNLQVNVGFGFRF